MATGKKIETRGHLIGFREEISRAASASDDEFFTWFDSASDRDAAFVRGSWDFMYHIASPTAEFLSRPEDKTALEIGYGGGRLMAAACRSFKMVVGVDIHDHQHKVANELGRRGSRNFELLRTEGADLPVRDGSFDFAYSFIVLQHVEKYEIFKKYLFETLRVLKPGGIAVLYFGRKSFFSYNRPSKILCLLDRIIEGVLLPRGYVELPAKINCENLLVSMSHARKLAEKAGFAVLRERVSRRKVPDGTALYGGQNGLVLRKKP